MQILKLQSGQSFKTDDDKFYVITQGYIVYTKTVYDDDVLYIVQKKSPNLQVKLLEFIFERCDIIPIDDFKHKEFYYRDIYELKEKGESHKIDKPYYDLDITPIDATKSYIYTKWSDIDNRHKLFYNPFACITHLHTL